MTKKERAMLLKAIDHFMDDDPDKWTDGMNIIHFLAHGVTWTETLGLGESKAISPQELIRKIRSAHASEATPKPD